MTSEISHTSIINGQHLSYRAGSSWSSSRALKRGNYIDSLRLAIVQQNTKIIRAKISNLIEKAVNADHTQGGQHVY